MRRSSSAKRATRRVRNAALHSEAVLSALDEALAQDDSKDFLALLRNTTGQTLTPETVRRLEALEQEFENERPALVTLFETEVKSADDWRNRARIAEQQGRPDLAAQARGRAEESRAAAVALGEELSARQLILGRVRSLLRDHARQ